MIAEPGQPKFLVTKKTGNRLTWLIYTSVWIGQKLVNRLFSFLVSVGIDQYFLNTSLVCYPLRRCRHGSGRILTTPGRQLYRLHKDWQHREPLNPGWKPTFNGMWHITSIRLILINGVKIVHRIYTKSCSSHAIFQERLHAIWWLLESIKCNNSNAQKYMCLALFTVYLSLWCKFLNKITISRFLVTSRRASSQLACSLTPTRRWLHQSSNRLRPPQCPVRTLISGLLTVTGVG